MEFRRPFKNNKIFSDETEPDKILTKKGNEKARFRLPLKNIKRFSDET
jgi:hypothetical protein